MATREPQEDPKKPAKPPARRAPPDEPREAERRTSLDPFADEHPAICRGID